MKRLLLILLTMPLLAAGPEGEWKAISGEWTFGRNSATCNGDGEAIFGGQIGKEFTLDCIICIREWRSEVSRITIHWGAGSGEEDSAKPQAEPHTGIQFCKDSPATLGVFRGRTWLRKQHGPISLLPNKPLRVRVQSHKDGVRVLANGQVVLDPTPPSSEGMLYLRSRGAVVSFTALKIQSK